VPTETIIRSTDAPRFGDDGTEIRGYASPSRGSAALSAWRLRLAPGAASPVHSLTHGEVFLALEGSGRFEVAGRVHDVGAGDAICVPAGVALRLANTAAEPFEAVCCMPAGGMGQIGDGEPFTPPWAA
jgi:quercetin dioxygenase-like cupin family protein